MKPLREVLAGFLSVIITALIVFGAASAGISEGLLSAVYATQPVDELRILTILPGMPTPKPRATQHLKVITNTPTTVNACPIPRNWQPYSIQPGDTLEELATSRKVSTALIMQGNCLVSTSLLTGTTLYLPREPQPTLTSSAALIPTLTPQRCGPPRTWIRYIVQPSDTLFRLSYLYGVSVLELQFANCLTDSLIRVGEVLYVPNVATRTLSPTPVTPTNTTVPTRTYTITLTPSITLTPTITLTPSKTPTRTITLTFTKTLSPTPTLTFTKTSTPTRTPTPTSTSTRTPTPTSTATPTITPTGKSAGAPESWLWWIP